MINLWEGLALIGTSSTILGVFLAISATINNKAIKLETKLTREVLAETIAEESRLTREMIKETTEYLGKLIVADGERTRLAMKK